MIRVIAENVLLFLLPTAMYVGYVLLTRRTTSPPDNLLSEAPLVWRNKFAAVGYSAGKLYESAWYEVEIVDRLGAGDALAAGLIHGLLDGDLGKGVDYGGAMGALKHTIPGDLAWIDKDEVEAALGGAGLRVRR